MTYKLSNLSVANEGYTNLTNYGVSLAILTFFNRRCRRLVCCRFRWREFPTARRCYSRHRRRSGSARRHGRGRFLRRHRQRSSLKKMKKKKLVENAVGGDGDRIRRRSLTDTNPLMFSTVLRAISRGKIAIDLTI